MYIWGVAPGTHSRCIWGVAPGTHSNDMQFKSSAKVDRRRFGQLVAASAVSAALGGCSKSEAGERLPDIVWGKLGANPGQFSKPRAITIDDKDQLYIVALTARIQVFDVDGTYIRSWHTPEQTSPMFT